ncbi:MAG: efflux RND transporter permease subunit [Alphaproteobacteria bacterium]|nr:efflux RND transporter permease subunit [Alphaproteobacteria bacterium]
MTLSEICIRRPVLATVMSLLITLIGAVAYDRLSVREYPKIDEPVVTVETTYTGAGAEIMESQVTQPLEESLAGIEGVDIMSSISRAERSSITIRFNLDREPDAAAADVRDRVGRARDILPDEVDEPVIAKVEADADPIIWISFTSDRHSAMQLTDTADRLVKDRLQSLAGVADVLIFGERRYAMRIWLDPARLAGYGLTVQDVEDALRAQNVEIPAGRIESVDREFTVLAETDLATRSGFEGIILREVDGYPVRLSDVGRAEISAADDRVIFRIDGKNGVGLGVIKQSTANPLDVSNAVQAAMPGIASALPEGMDVEVAYDSSVFIAKSIDAVFTTMVEATALVVLVIFVFLRSLRATIIPVVTIPVSLITTFALMLALGFSINTLTLLAMVLAIGLVVDDAIVVIENIHRHIEAGMAPVPAAFKGIREIGFAVVAMTVSLAAVYVPVGFQEGRTGRLFTEFAITLAGAVLVSGFVALTLSPMMCSRLLRHGVKHGWAFTIIERALDRLTAGYRVALRATLGMRALVVLAVVGVGAFGFMVAQRLPSELAPIEDRGVVVAIVIAPEGSTIDYTDRYARRVEEILGRTADVDRYGIVPGYPVVTQAIAFVVLRDWGQRTRPQGAVTDELGPQLFGLPGVLAFAINPPPLGQGFASQPISFVVQSSEPYAELDRMMQALVAEAITYPGFANIDTDLKLNKPEIKVIVDRDKLADLGITVETVGRTLETLLGGRQVTRFKYQGKQYDVIVKTGAENRTRPTDLTEIHVRTDSGAMIPLANAVSLHESVAPKELNHFNKLRSVTLNASLNPGYSIGDGLAYLEAAAARVLPASAQIDYAEQSREFKEASAGLYLTLALAIAFIYLVMAAQFESFIDPIVILLTVPLAMAGALLALDLTGGTLNVYSQIGLVTLVGLITKHGILIVDFANQLRLLGRSARDAVVEAASLRLRPILMTTGAMVLGSLPLALATGAGAESRHQIGWVIVGGMTLGTILTLFVVPAIYSILSLRRRPDLATDPVG